MKKIILIIVLFLLVLAGGLAFYKYFTIKTKTQNFNEDPKIEMPIEQEKPSNKTPQDINAEIKNQDTIPQKTNYNGALTVCLDRCDDGICQKTDPDCENNNLNCICPETKTECPQDCK